jgi:hypothetical protein
MVSIIVCVRARECKFACLILSVVYFSVLVVYFGLFYYSRVDWVDFTIYDTFLVSQICIGHSRWACVCVYDSMLVTASHLIALHSWYVCACAWKISCVRSFCSDMQT